MVAEDVTPDTVKSSASVSPVRSIALGTLWRFLRYPVIVVTALTIPRLMGTTTYGQYALFLSVFVILDMVADVGFNLTFGRFLPEMKDNAGPQAAHLLHQLLLSATVIAFVIGVVASLTLLAWGRYNLPSWGYLFLIVLVLVARVKGTLFGFLYGRNEIGRFSVRDLLRSVLMLATVVGMYTVWGLAGALVAVMATEVALLALAVVWTRGALFTTPKAIRWCELKPHLRFGFTFYVPMLLLGLLHRIGVPVIELLSGATDQAGHFDVANQYVTMSGAFLSLIFTTLLPSLTRMQLDDDHHEIARWQAVTMACCGIVFVLTTHALLLVGRDIILLCLGDAFAPIFPCAVVLTPAIPAMLMIYAGMNYTLLRKEPSVFTRAVLWGLVAMLAASVFWVPDFLALGAAMASIIGYIVAAGLIAFAYRNEFVPMLIAFAKVALLGLVLVPVYLVPVGLVGRMILLVLSCLGFIVIVFRVGVLDITEARKLLLSLRQKA